MASRSLTLSLMSGFLAALASVLGKLGMASDRAAILCRTIISACFDTSLIEAFYMCESVSVVQATSSNQLIGSLSECFDNSFVVLYFRFHRLYAVLSYCR